MSKSKGKLSSVNKNRAKIHNIYMDHASSALPNPSSIHEKGVEEKRKLEKAREKIANILNTQSRNIIFTSGGTESNNIAIQGMVYSYLENHKDLPHIITTNIEHSSVLDTCKMLEKRKLAEVSIVRVESSGIVDPKKIIKEIKNNTILISVMYANNEIGTIEPIQEIAKELRHFKKKRELIFSNGLAERIREEDRGPEKNLVPVFYLPFLHTDAVQAVNYLDMNVEKLGVDLLSFSGSKIVGSPRVGVLYKKGNVPLLNIYGGGDQEFGLRPGTEDVSKIVLLAKALEETQKNKEKENKRLLVLRNYFIKKLKLFDGVEINGDQEFRLPNNINITIPKIPSDLLVLELSARGIYVSEKSACKSGDKKGSYVIEAISGINKGSLRFSFGRKTSKSDIDYVIKSLLDILKKLKRWYD